MSTRFLAAKITTAHGIRGFVKLQVFTEDPQILNGNPLYPTKDSNTPLTLTLKNSMGKFWLAAVEGVTDRNEAEALRGTELWMERTLLPSPEDDEYYSTDLEGLTVEDLEGKLVGTVIGLDNFGAGDLLEIKPQTGDSFYLLFTKENVPHIDLEAGVVRIKAENA